MTPHTSPFAGPFSPAEPATARARRLTVAAMFSLEPRPARAGGALHTAALAAARALDTALQPGAVGHITGPSGAGKSTVLAAVARAVRSRRHRVVVVPPAACFLRERRSPIELLRGPLMGDIRLLCAAGLAEAPVWIRPARRLSEGQRWRLALALAWSRAHSRDTLIADEFASTLDRDSARSLCVGVRRLARPGTGPRLVLASAHADLARWIDADVTLAILEGFAHHGRHTLRTRKERP